MRYWGLPRRRNERHALPLDAAETDSFCRWVRWAKPRRILEVGAGSGRIVSILLEMGLGDQLTACDFTDCQREWCRANTGILPDAWDGFKLPYSDGSFGLVLSMDVLLHVPPVGAVDFVREHNRVCARWLIVASLDRCENEKLAPHCFCHDNEETFRRAGLEIVKVKRFGNRAHWLLRDKPDIDGR